MLRGYEMNGLYKEHELPQTKNTPRAAIGLYTTFRIVVLKTMIYCSKLKIIIQH